MMTRNTPSIDDIQRAILKNMQRHIDQDTGRSFKLGQPNTARIILDLWQQGFELVSNTRLLTALGELVADKKLVEWKLNDEVYYALPGTTLSINGVAIPLPI